MFPIDKTGRPPAPAYDDGTVRCYLGDVRAVLATLPDETAHCVATSPPYWGLRAYDTVPQVWGGDRTCGHRWGPELRTPWANGMPGPNGRAKNPRASRCHPRMTGPFCSRCGAWRGELGREPSVDLYVEHLVDIFRQVRRVLRRDGVVWLNMGDSYTSGGRSSRDPGKSRMNGGGRVAGLTECGARPATPVDLKPKDLIGVPWRVAFALQADGWWLRQDVVWAKPNPMPESVRDRPTRSHEYVFLLSKSRRYFYDDHAVREPAKYGYRTNPRALPRSGRTARSSALWRNAGTSDIPVERGHDQGGASFDPSTGRNRRSVWTIATQPCPDAHFATFPQALPSICIRAGSSAGGCCPECGAPWKRTVGRTSELRDADRRQARRAVELFNEAGLTQRHRDAIVAAGVSDAGKARVTQRGTGRNDGDVQRLADEAKAALGGYYREFLLGGESTFGWRPTCSHTADPVPCTVLDPFAGTGTALAAAKVLGRQGIGVELNPTYVEMLSRRVSAVGGERRAA